MKEYRTNSTSRFIGGPYGLADARESNERGLHLRVPQDIGGSHDDLMNGKPGIFKGTTSGFVDIDRTEDGQISKVEITDYTSPDIQEQYTIDADGSLVAKKIYCNRSAEVFKGMTSRVGAFFSEIDGIVRKLKQGRDLEVNVNLRNIAYIPAE